MAKTRSKAWQFNLALSIAAGGAIHCNQATASDADLEISQSGQPNLYFTESSLAPSAGDNFRVQRGWLTVPETRGKQDTKNIRIGFLRLRSERSNTTAPTFVLPGGPGASWIEEMLETASSTDAKWEQTFLRQHFLEDLRALGDVVVVDQRGAGTSSPRLSCSKEYRIADHRPITDQEFKRTALQFADGCVAELRAAGIDMSGYTILEMVQDLDDLRRILGYEEINLFAGSFGSQWGLAYIREHEESVRRFIFWGVEGLDHTYDSAAGVLRSLSAAYEDNIALPRSSEEIAPFEIELVGLGRAFRTTPWRAVVPRNPGHERAYLGPEAIHRVIFGAENFSVNSRESVRKWIDYVSELFAGQYASAFTTLQAAKLIYSPGATLPLYYAVDCALGISTRRREHLENEAASQLLGNINRHYDVICANWPHADVGDDNRTSRRSQLRGLLIHGTWDVSTPLENAAEVAEYFPNAQLIIVQGATHRVIRELYREAPHIVRPLVVQFLAGNDGATPKVIRLPKLPNSRR